MITIFTATTYSIDWITTNIEIDSRAITPLSGKGSIYERYEEDCKKNGQIPIPKQTLSQKLVISFALSHQITLLKKRKRDGIVFEGIRLKKCQQEPLPQKDPKEKQLATQP